MNKVRLEAFSDGVLAIIITIMVLEIKVPHDTSWHSLAELRPVLLSYILSFIYVGIYWGNHHHLLHAVKRVNSSIIWANLHLLFWLSLVPLVTSWMGENHMEPNTIVAYAIVLLMCGVAFTILQMTIEKSNPFTEKMAAAYKKVMQKGIASLIGYSLAIGLAFVNTYISCAIIIFIAILWIVPDKHIENAVKNEEKV
ncbi:MAG: TMEM175 family protein [Flavitalea sp.]